MSMAGKIYCDGGEDCVWECWQNEKTLSWKVISQLVKKVYASISNNLYVFFIVWITNEDAFSGARIKFLFRWNNSCVT